MRGPRFKHRQVSVLLLGLVRPTPSALASARLSFRPEVVVSVPNCLLISRSRSMWLARRYLFSWQSTHALCS